MIALWIAAALIAGAAFGLIVLLSARPVVAAADAARGVYRRQLTEIDDLAGRGLLGDEERKAAHAEAARRLLGEEDSAPEIAPDKASRTIAIVAAAAVALVALGTYVLAGAPSRQDQSYARRIAEWQQSDPSTLAPEQLIALIQKALPNVPDDRKGSILVVQGKLELNNGDFASAERTLEKALAGNPENVEGWELLAQARMMIAGRKYSPKAREAIEKALALDPKRIMPRYLMARADLEAGKTAEGVARLRGLLAESGPEGKAILEKEIAEAEGRVAPTPQVTADPAILAMVNGLAARLKANPDDPAGWQRLIRSYTVLGDKPGLEKALAEARVFFKNRPADLAAIEQAGNAPAPAPTPGMGQ